MRERGLFINLVSSVFTNSQKTYLKCYETARFFFYVFCDKWKMPGKVQIKLCFAKAFSAVVVIFIID